MNLPILAVLVLSFAPCGAGHAAPERAGKTRRDADRRVAQRVAAAVVHIRVIKAKQPLREQSGVLLWSYQTNGYLASHLPGIRTELDAGARVEVVLSTMRVAAAELVGDDPRTGIALLKIPGPIPRTVRRGSAPPLSSRTRYLAVTNPTGLGSNIARTTFRQTYLCAPGDTLSCLLLRFEPPIRSAERGGIVIQENGQAVGLLVGRPEASPRARDLATRDDDPPPESESPRVVEPPSGSYVIPMKLVSLICHSIVKVGDVRRGHVGASVGWLDRKGLPVYGPNAPQGVVVLSILPGGPADRAGLRRDDLVIAVGKKKLRGIADLLAVAERVEFFLAGKPLELTVLRPREPGERGDPQERKITVLVGHLPAPEPVSPSRPVSGPR